MMLCGRAFTKKARYERLPDCLRRFLRGRTRFTVISRHSGDASSRHNVADPPLADDLISCRNLPIYLSPVCNSAHATFAAPDGRPIMGLGDVRQAGGVLPPASTRQMLYSEAEHPAGRLHFSSRPALTIARHSAPACQRAQPTWVSTPKSHIRQPDCPLAVRPRGVVVNGTADVETRRWWRTPGGRQTGA
jgi:hypothetical protein